MGLVGNGIGNKEGLRVDTKIFREDESTVRTTPKIVLKVEEKSALVKASLILKDRSEIGVVRLSITTSKLIAHSKDNNFRCSMCQQ